MNRAAKNASNSSRGEIFYRSYGNGRSTMIAFHGYGQDHQVFEELGKLVGHRYTVFSIDLFFHGKSPWLSCNDRLSKSEWWAVITQFFETNQITTFTLVGYSMGGRFALTLVEYFAERIHELVLIAPDGIKKNLWYRFASSTLIGNRLLKISVTRPGLFLHTISLAHQLKVLDKGIVKFAAGYMNTRRKRYEVYCRWTVLQKIDPTMPTVIRQCNRHQISVLLYLGRYDRIIKASDVKLLSDNVKSSSTHHLPYGHNDLIHGAALHYARSLS